MISQREKETNRNHEIYIVHTTKNCISMVSDIKTLEDIINKILKKWNNEFRGCVIWIHEQQCEIEKFFS